jgi:hypothetical protein
MASGETGWDSAGRTQARLARSQRRYFIGIETGKRRLNAALHTESSVLKANPIVK